MDHVWLSLIMICLLLIDCNCQLYRRQVSEEFTAYTCEGSMMELNCPHESQVISIISANFGRYAIGICNPESDNTLRTDCMTPQAFKIVRKRCTHKHGCRIPVNTSIFGDDWCPGTPKYLKVVYVCWLASYITIAPPATIVVRTTPRTTTSTTTRTTTTTAASTTTSSTTSSSTARSVPTTQLTRAPIPMKRTTAPVPIKRITTLSTKRPRTIPYYPVPGEELCIGRIQRNISWSDAQVGRTATEACPTGSTGVATWRCGKEGNWLGQPNLKDCHSEWVQNIKKQISQGAPVTDVTSDLMRSVKSRPLYGSDLRDTASTMKYIIDEASVQLKNKSEMEKKKIAQNITESMVELGSSLLSTNHMESWKDLASADQSQIATEIAYSLEVSGLQVADAITTPMTVSKTDDNVALEVQVLSDAMPEGPVAIPAKENSISSSDTISISSDVLKDNSRDGLIRVVYISYDNIGQWMSTKQNDVTGDENTTPPIVNTRVFSLSVNKLKHVHALKKPFHFILEHKQVTNVSNPSCVYWDYDKVSMKGQWSNIGCKLATSNDTHTHCTCSHLTNFAVLMDVSGTKLPTHHEVSLQVITYAGCIISIICLFLTWLTFTVFRNLQSDRATIHKNLVFCLFVAEIIFLLGILETSNVVACAIVAGLLHFFFLAAFAWMCLEGIQLYLMLIEVFEGERSRIPFFYIAGYGIPALIVTISAAVDHHSYGTDRHCWLRTDNYFVWSFTGPVCAVITVNIAMLSIAIYMMCHHSPATPSLKGATKTKTENIKSWIKGAAVLVVLLGLTWSFGILYISEETVVMAYVFTLFNSLQGVFIFVFHCLLNDKVQKEYKRWSRQRSWLPDCVRVGYGGQVNEDTSLPTPSSSSSGPAHYFQKIFTGRRRRRSGCSSSGKSQATTKSPLQQDFYPSLSHQGTLPYNGEYTLSSKSHRAAPQSPTFNRNGIIQCEIRHNGITGNLSQVSASVVDTDSLTDYCQNCDHIYETIDGRRKYESDHEYLEPLSHRGNTRLDPNVRECVCRCEHGYSCTLTPRVDVMSDISDEELFQLSDVVEKTVGKCKVSSDLGSAEESKPLVISRDTKPDVIPYTASEEYLVNKLRTEAHAIRSGDNPIPKSACDLDSGSSACESPNRSAPNLNGAIDCKKSEQAKDTSRPVTPGGHRSSLPNLNDWVTFDSLERKPGETNLRRLCSDGPDIFDPHRYRLTSTDC